MRCSKFSLKYTQLLQLDQKTWCRFVDQKSYCSWFTAAQVLSECWRKKNFGSVLCAVFRWSDSWEAMEYFKGFSRTGLFKIFQSTPIWTCPRASSVRRERASVDTGLRSPGISFSAQTGNTFCDKFRGDTRSHHIKTPPKLRIPSNESNDLALAQDLWNGRSTLNLSAM